MSIGIGSGTDHTRSCGYHLNLPFAPRVALYSFIALPISYEFHRLSRIHCLPIYFISIYSYASLLDYPMFLGYPRRGGFESSHKSLSTKGRGKSNVGNIVSWFWVFTSQVRVKTVQMGNIDSTHSISPRSHSSSHSEENSIFSVSPTKLISKHFQSTSQCKLIQISTRNCA